MSSNFDSAPLPAPPAPEPASNTPVPPGAPRRTWLTPTLALLAVLMIGLFGGVLIGHATPSSAQASSVNGLSRGQTGGSGGAGFAGNSLASGTIHSITGTTMVVSAPDGTTQTVTTSGTTRVTKTTAITLSELKVGQKVTVAGVAGANGDIAARSVSEGARPPGARPGRANGGTRSGSTGGAND